MIAAQGSARPADTKTMLNDTKPSPTYGPRCYSERRSASGGIEIRWTESAVLSAGVHTVPGPGADLDAGRALLARHGYTEVG